MPLEVIWLGVLPTSSTPFQLDAPFRGPIDTGDQVEDRRLSGSVWTDDADQFPFLQIQIEFGYSAQPAEVMSHILNLKKHRLPPSFAARACWQVDNIRE